MTNCIRSFLIISLFLANAVCASEVINDVTQINPILVDEVKTPTSIEEVQNILKTTTGKVSIGGGRYSMGGQTATEHAIQIDMRKMNKVLNLDEKNKQVTVQAGIRWRDLQEYIDPHNLSIKIMQTYSNFTVGGSLSVNVHGRYIGQGPIVRSVQSLRLVLADGSVVEASREKNSEAFFGAIGGYGGLGVIAEVTLQLADNEKIERTELVLPTKEYRKYFFENIRDNPKAVFHNGDIYPPEFDKVSLETWVKTDKELTIKERLIPKNQKYVLQPKTVEVIASMPLGKELREHVLDPLRYREKVVVWRNHEASYDVAELEPASRKNSTYVLQEYFVPVEKFEEWIPKMRAVFQKNKVNVLNVSIRHALPDPGSLLAWAKEEVFAFVVYYKQGTKPEDKQKVAEWTREMIGEVLTVGGRYYLPYQIHATDAQFQQAYPRYKEYFDLKKKLDPDYRFRNKLWDKYYQPIPKDVTSAIQSLPDYHRGVEQTYLTLPEWYIVFNSDEYANFLKTNRPSEFPYWKSARQFWDLKNQIEKHVTGQYELNFGYEAMLWVIGSSYSAELVLKGLYENSIGRLTEWLADEKVTSLDLKIQSYHQQYADFVHIFPWYEFPFYTKLQDFWAGERVCENSSIRKWERSFFLPSSTFSKRATAG